MISQHSRQQLRGRNTNENIFAIGNVSVFMVRGKMAIINNAHADQTVKEQANIPIPPATMIKLPSKHSFSVIFSILDRSNDVNSMSVFSHQINKIANSKALSQCINTASSFLFVSLAHSFLKFPKLPIFFYMLSQHLRDYNYIYSMNKQEQLYGESQIIFDQQPLPQIQEISINTLNIYSNQFRVSYEEIQSEHSSKKHYSEEAQIFHQGIVTLIGKIQPSKLAIANIEEALNMIRHTYFPHDDKYKLRNEAKEKKILIINKLTAEEQFELVSEIYQEMQKFKRFILIRQSQLGAVLFLEDNRKLHSQEKLKNVYRRSYEEILEFVIPVQDCLKPINFQIISKIFKYEYTLFDDFTIKTRQLQAHLEKFEDHCMNCKLISNEHQVQIDKSLRQLKILTSKLATLVQLFPFACLKSKGDLFSYELTHKRWKNLFENDVLLYKLYGQPDKIDKSFNQLRTNLNIVNATMNIFNQAKINPKGLRYWTAQFQSIKKVLKCTVSAKTAHHQAEMMISQPSQELAKEIWNLPQKKQFKIFIELAFPTIAFSQQFYIPRKLREYFFAKLDGANAQLPDYKIRNKQDYFNQLYVSTDHRQKLSIRINNFFELDLKEFQQVQQNQSNFFHKHLNILNKNIKNNIQSIKKAFKKQSPPPPKTVIFHIHGGGFISMSSFIHQTYTRKWSNSLNVPIVSVDYGKAPEYPYPQGLYDCLEAYMWTLHCFTQLYKVQPQKIILVGDSAGGNLVSALTNLLIQWKLRVPNGIVLAYPALNLNYFDFTPSLLTALNDMILPHTFLKICLKSYLKDPNFKPQSNYFISPMYAPPHIIKQYPPTRIFVGSKDPFHDDCCRFAQKINQYAPRKVKLLVFQEFPHGFLQFDMKNSPHYYCQQATKQVQNALGQLMKY